MRKLIAVFFFNMVVAQSLMAYGFGDLYDDFADQTKITVLKSAEPGYFYDLRTETHKGGVITPVVDALFLEANAGWITPYDAGKRGTAILGGGVKLDKFVNYWANQMGFHTENIMPLILPGSALALWDRIRIGYYLGHDFDTTSATMGFYSTVEFKF